MQLFAEFSGVCEGARRQRLYVYRVTWVAREQRLLWTALIERSDMPATTVRGVIALLGNFEAMEERVRASVHRAINDEAWVLPSDLAPLGVA